uniref:HTH_48 domain-containing protein n=1 Tax=Strongyloides papillosus TaxID=174720 RepID=A0A0N5CIK8_STREA
MLAFNNLLIFFLIIFIYQTTGNDSDITDQCITEVNGVFNCKLKDKGKEAIYGISFDSFLSSPRYIKINSESHGKNFSIQGKFNCKNNEKPDLYFHVRTICFKEEDRNKGCRIKIYSKKIPSDFIISGHGEDKKVWYIGSLEFPKSDSDFKEGSEVKTSIKVSEAFSQGSTNKRTIQRWFQKFQNQDMSFQRKGNSRKVNALENKNAGTKFKNNCSEARR